MYGLPRKRLQQGTELLCCLPELGIALSSNMSALSSGGRALVQLHSVPESFTSRNHWLRALVIAFWQDVRKEGDNAN